MPKKAFPLSKSSSYRLGSEWTWCVTDLACEDHSYRLLVAFNQGREQYQGWLGLVRGDDLALLGRLEFHPDGEHGWHCHLRRGDLVDVTSGVVKQPRSRDRARFCRSYDFGVSERNALEISFRVFNVIRPSVTHELFA